MPITYGSVCSGIEAATCAWHPLGWEAEWLAEIEPFPSAVLAHHYPNTPNLGDMTKLAAQVLAGRIPAPDILVGGTPCQAFSVAGMRQGMLDPRGALTIKYVELADATDLIRTRRGEPEAIVVWENVPGVLSDKGNAFGCFLGALAGEDCELQPAGKRWADAGCVYGPKRTIAWRILDAQYFGLAQRRRRVFVVASARAGFDPVAVLFEREGVRRDTAPRRGEGQDLAGRAPFGPALQCGCGHIHDLSLGAWGCPDCEGDEGPSVEVMAGIPAFGGENQAGSLFQAGALNAHGVRHDFATETFCVAPTMAGGGRKHGGYSLDDIPLTSVSLRAQAQPSHRADSETYIPVAGTLQANGKAAGSATQQDAESGLLVVHGTQDPCVSDKAFALGRNSGQENVVLAFSCKDYGNDVTSDLAPTLRAMGHGDSHANAGGQVAVCVTGEITHTLKADGFDGSEDGTGRGQPIVATVAGTIGANHGNVKAEHAWTGQLAATHSAVRRLTPTECERLQGFEDDYTLIPWRTWQEAARKGTSYEGLLLERGMTLRGPSIEECPDGPRYKAIGNSKAVPVVRWIGRRIQLQL